VVAEAALKVYTNLDKNKLFYNLLTSKKG